MAVRVAHIDQLTVAPTLLAIERAQPEVTTMNWLQHPALANFMIIGYYVLSLIPLAAAIGYLRACTARTYRPVQGYRVLAVAALSPVILMNSQRTVLDNLIGPHRPVPKDFYLFTGIAFAIAALISHLVFRAFRNRQHAA